MIVLFLALNFISPSLGLGQNIINVNNIGSNTGDYTTLQEAVDSASAGDVIYLYPSSTSYGSATINKQVTIIGPGYWVQSNPSLGILTYIANGVADNITLMAGADGTYITGVDFNYLSMEGVNNVVISRNRVRNRIYMKNTSNVIVEGCYFDLVGDYQGSTADENWLHLSAHTNNSSMIVRNNIFYAYTFASGNCGYGYSSRWLDNIYIGPTSSAIVENNIFRDRCHFNNSIVRNNIFLMTDQYANCADNPISYDASSCNIKYNVLVKNQTGLDTTNIVGVDVNTLFEGYPTQGSRSFDDRFMLKAGSPAIGAGAGGIDCGVYDGVSPYRLSGLPFIPVVYELNGPSQGTASQGIDVTVKVRSNN